MLEVTKKKTVKTRKKYECRGCCETIDKGSAAVHIRGKEDGHYTSFHIHILCHIFIMKQKLFVEGFYKGAVKQLKQEINDYSVENNDCPF